MADALTDALLMSDDRASWILTWTDEPELLAQPGEPSPAFTAAEVEAARLRSSWQQPSAAEDAEIIALCAFRGIEWPPR